MTYIYLMQHNLTLLTEIKACLCIWAFQTKCWPFFFQDLSNGNAVTAIIANSEPWLFPFACLGLINLDSMLEGNIDHLLTKQEQEQEQKHGHENCLEI